MGTDSPWDEGFKTPVTVFKPMSPEQQKHEEIKRITEKMVIQTFCLPKPTELKDLPDDIFFKTVADAAWDVAEKFYDYAKAKEKEKQGV